MAFHDDPTLPPLRTPEARAEREAWRPWAVVIVVASIVLACLLVGCAQVPECENPRIDWRTTPAGTRFYIMDEQTMDKLLDVLNALNDGRCRYHLQGERT